MQYDGSVYTYPAWAHWTGRILAASTMSCIPIGAILALIKARVNIESYCAKTIAASCCQTQKYVGSWKKLSLTWKPSEAGRFKQDAFIGPMYRCGYYTQLWADAWWSKRPVSSSVSSLLPKVDEKTKRSQVDFGALAKHLVALHRINLSMCQLCI